MTATVVDQPPLPEPFPARHFGARVLRHEGFYVCQGGQLNGGPTAAGVRITANAKRETGGDLYWQCDHGAGSVSDRYIVTKVDGPVKNCVTVSGSQQ